MKIFETAAPKRKDFNDLSFDMPIIDRLNEKQLADSKNQPFIRMKVVKKVAEVCSTVLETTDSILAQTFIKVDRKLVKFREKYGFLKGALDVVGLVDLDEARRKRWDELLKTKPLPARGMEFSPQERLRQQNGQI